MSTERSELRCAPWCGFGCTEKDYQDAQARGTILVQRLGEGWTVRVVENMGWHASAVSPCGRIRVSGSQMPLDHAWYTAFLNNTGELGGRWAEGARTPKAAVRKVVKVAKAEVAELGAIIEGL